MSIDRWVVIQNGTHGSGLWPCYVMVTANSWEDWHSEAMIVKLLRRNKPGNKTGYKTALGLPRDVVAGRHATRPPSST